MNRLPEICYATLPSTGEVIVIKKDELGYCPVREEKMVELRFSTDSDDNRKIRDTLNDRLGVSVPERCAMEHGSMFGWDTYLADPDSWTAEGRPIRKVNRLEATL